MQSHAESWHKLRCCHFLVKSVGQFKLKERERERLIWLLTITFIVV